MESVHGRLMIQRNPVRMTGMFPCLPNRNGISVAAPRDAAGWLSGRSMWGEITLFFRRFFCRSCRRRGGGRAGLRSSIPCSFLMIPGELDEGIEEIVRGLEVARFHLCSNLLVLHGTHVFLHIAQLLNLFLILTDGLLLTLYALFQLGKGRSFGYYVAASMCSSACSSGCVSG